MAGTNPLSRLGERAFRFSVVYSIISTLIATALATAGVEVPKVLLLMPFDSKWALDAVRELSTAPFVAAGTLLKAFTFVVANVFFGIMLSVPTLVDAIFSSVAPELIAIGRFISAVIAASILLYIAETVLGGS